MNHFVVKNGNRVMVGHMIPGTNVFSADADYPIGFIKAAENEAKSRSTPAAAEIPPEQRRIPKGFYEDQGNLF